MLQILEIQLSIIKLTGSKPRLIGKSDSSKNVDVTALLYFLIMLPKYKLLEATVK